MTSSRRPMPTEAIDVRARLLLAREFGLLPSGGGPSAQSNPDLNPNFKKKWRFGHNWGDYPMPPDATPLEQFQDEMKHHPFHTAKEVANMRPVERAGWLEEKARRLEVTRLQRSVREDERRVATAVSNRGPEEASTWKRKGRPMWEEPRPDAREVSVSLEKLRSGLN